MEGGEICGKSLTRRTTDARAVHSNVVGMLLELWNGKTSTMNLVRTSLSTTNKNIRTTNVPHQGRSEDSAKGVQKKGLAVAVPLS